MWILNNPFWASKQQVIAFRRSRFCRSTLQPIRLNFNGLQQDEGKLWVAKNWPQHKAHLFSRNQESLKLDIIWTLEGIKTILKVKTVSTSLHIPDFMHLVCLMSFGFIRDSISPSLISRSFLSNEASFMQFGGHLASQISPQSQVCSSA